jgi:hypothetical protein
VVGNTTVSVAGIGRAETSTTTFTATEAPTTIFIAWPDSDEACFESFKVDGMAATGVPLWLDNPVNGSYEWFADARRRRLDAGGGHTCDCSVSCSCAATFATFALVAPQGGGQDGSQGQGAAGGGGLPIPM